METAALLNILKEQKLPLDEAVRQKIMYLQSDDAFNQQSDQYISFLREDIFEADENDKLMAAFESGEQNEFEKESFDDFFMPPIEVTPQMPAATQTRPQQQIRQASQTNSQSQPMTMAQKIAALRGSLNIPAEYKRK